MTREEKDYEQLIAEEDKYIEDVIMNGTAEDRADWDLEDWVYGIRFNCWLLEKKDCPIDGFTPENWRDIIVDGGGVEVQFCPCPDRVLPLLSKKDFAHWDSNTVCTAIVLEGEWLAHLLPLDEITQEDFDDLLVCDPDDYASEEDVMELIAVRFPDNKIPAHLNYPHKGESRQK